MYKTIIINFYYVYFNIDLTANTNVVAIGLQLKSI